MNRNGPCDPWVGRAAVDMDSDVVNRVFISFMKGKPLRSHVLVLPDSILNQRPDKHPVLFDEQEAVLDRLRARNLIRMNPTPVPDRLALRPGQFGTGFGSILIRFQARSRSKTGPCSLKGTGCLSGR